MKRGKRGLISMATESNESSAKEQLRTLLQDHCGGPERRKALLSTLETSPVCAFRRLMQAQQSKLMATGGDAARTEYLKQLPGSTLGMLWPADRVGLGMMTSKWLRAELIDHAPSVAFTIASPWDECTERESLGTYLSLFKSKTVSLSYEQRTMDKCCQPVVEALEHARLERLQLLEVSSDDAFRDPVPCSLFSSLTNLSLRSCNLRGQLWWACTSLSVLVLSDCLLESFALPGIADFVATNAYLTHLDLSKNRFGQQPLSVAERLLHLGKCTTVTHLDLSSNFLGVEAIPALADIIAKVNFQRLHLSNNIFNTALEVVELIVRLRDIRHIDLSHCQSHLSRGGRGGCQAVSTLLFAHPLEHLDWSGNRVSSSGLAVLTEGIGHCQTLTELSLSGCSISKGARKLALSLPQSLRHLDLGDNCIKPRDVDHIVAALPSMTDLRHLVLSDMPLGSSRLSRLLGHECTALTSLCLNGTGIGRAKLVRDVGDVLGRSSGLTHLDLGDAALDSSCARSVFGGEEGGGGHVRVLGLGENVMGTRGFASAARWLAGNEAMTHLDLSHNLIGGEGARLLRPLLGAWWRLEVLELGENGLQDDGVRSVVEGLSAAGCRRLRHVGLSGNGFGDCGMARLVPVLKRNYQLRHLDLVQNNIGQEGGGMLAALLLWFAARVDFWRRVWVDVQGNPDMGEEAGMRLCSLDPAYVLVPGFNCVAGVPGFDCRVADRGCGRDREWVMALRAL